MDLLIVICLGYLLGSVPYGLILVKVFAKKNLTEIGSKNIGATNVLRSGHKFLAILTLLLDATKGLAAVLIAKYGFNLYFDLYAIAGLFAIVGHIFPVWLKFKGGKGISTSLGVVLAINPLLGLMCLITWLATAFIFKYSSLAAIVAFALLPLWTFFLDYDFVLFALVISLLTLFKHKENMIRLKNKTETKIKFKKND